MNWKIYKYLFVLVLLIFPQIFYGDKITKKNGQVLEGKIVSEDDISIKFDMNGIVIDLPQEEINEVIRESTPETAPEKARKLLTERDYIKALNLCLDNASDKTNFNEFQMIFKEAFAQYKNNITSAVQAGVNLDSEIENVKLLINIVNNTNAVSLFGGEDFIKSNNNFLKSQLAEGYYNRAKKTSETQSGGDSASIINDLKASIEAAPTDSQIYYKSTLTLGLYQEKLGQNKEAVENLQTAYDKASALSDRLTVKSHIDRVRGKIASSQQSSQTSGVPIRTIYTPPPLYVPTPSPTETPIPTPTPTITQKAREKGKAKNLIPFFKSLPNKALVIVKNPNIIKWVIIAAVLLIFNWVIPIKIINRKMKRGDIAAAKFVPYVKYVGLIPLVIYFLSSIFNKGSRRRCPYCNKLIDNIDSYQDMNFFICPHCNENISAIYDLKDYIEHLIKNVQMELSKDKKKASDSVIEKDAMVKLVRAIVTLAYRKRASDIHIEPEMEGVKVRARVDGLLYDILVLPRNIAAAIISAIKVMANLDIAEKRIPQDGRVKMWIDKSDIDIRLNTSPIPLGEKASLRLLDSSAVQIDSAKLGLEGTNLEMFERSIRKPHGIFLVTGPTGSGKSTTLYVAVRTINNGEKNIVTIEDPIEYQIKGINQMQVNNAQQFTFATGLRSILRQDPDVIMVGEIRDKETAEISIDAAMTGHLVFSTLHTIDAPTAFSRMNDLGISPRRYAPALELVIAQRLARVNCNECKKPYKPKKEDLESVGILNIGKDTIFMHGTGCEVCDKIGFYGRIALFEMLHPDEELKELIESGSTTSVIREMARKKGMRTLKEEGVFRVLQGLTTVEEIIRVTS